MEPSIPTTIYMMEMKLNSSEGNSRPWDWDSSTIWDLISSKTTSLKKSWPLRNSIRLNWSSSQHPSRELTIQLSHLSMGFIPSDRDGPFLPKFPQISSTLPTAHSSHNLSRKKMLMMISLLMQDFSLFPWELLTISSMTAPLMISWRAKGGFWLLLRSDLSRKNTKVKFLEWRQYSNWLIVKLTLTLCLICTKLWFLTWTLEEKCQ